MEHSYLASGLPTREANKRLAFLEKVLLPLADFDHALRRVAPKQYAQLVKIIGSSRQLTPQAVLGVLFPTPKCLCGRPLASLTPSHLFCSSACREAAKLPAFLEALEDAKQGNLRYVGGFSGMNAKARFHCTVHKVEFSCKAANALTKPACYRCLSEERSEKALARIRARKPRGKYKLKQVVISGRTFECQGYEEQAIRWLLANVKGLKVGDISVDREGGVPRFRYAMGRGRSRNYFPDLFVAKLNTVYEVKSMYTLGLMSNRKRWWPMNQAKARSVVEAGYKFEMLLMQQDGSRIDSLPAAWATMDKKDVVAQVGSLKTRERRRKTY